MKKGFIHSIESMGTVDGPGIRTVVFMSGCPLRCQYCHNIDVTIPKSGTEYSAQDLVKKVIKNKSYFDSSGGGVTFSGGEPFFQTDFLKECLTLLQKEGVHTVVDTSLFTTCENLEKIIPHTDLFMVSVKHMNDEKHKDLTRVSNVSIFENLRFLSKQKVKIRIRFLVLPNVTDTTENLEKFRDFMREIKPLEIELLPYYDYGVSKWKDLGFEYQMKNMKTPTESEIKKVCDYLSAFKVLCNH